MGVLMLLIRPDQKAILENCPEEMYHAHKSYGSTTFKTFLKSTAAHLAVSFPPSPQMKLGTLHHARMEGKRADQLGGDGRTKAGKAVNAEIETRGFTPTNATQNANLDAMEANTKANPWVADALAARGVRKEVSVFTPFGTLQLKTRPDLIIPVDDGVVVLADYKTCADGSPEGFAKAVINFSYHLQAVFYTKVWERATGDKVSSFVFVATENSAPNLVGIYRLSEDLIAEGEAAFEYCLAGLQECQETGVYPGYSPDMVKIDAPPWGFRFTKPGRPTFRKAS
jgi:ATP-dependent exoDNAse (exonuclease V) beta subunit